MGASSGREDTRYGHFDLALRDFEALGDLGGPDQAMLAEESVDTGYALELTHELDLLY